MPWKHHMLAILRNLNLEGYIEKEVITPIAKDPRKPTNEEKGVIRA